VLGWTAHRARTTDQLVATACAALVLIPLFFGSELERAALVAGGLLALLLVPRVRLPRRLATPLTTVASASLGIYLTHFALLPLLAHGVPSIVEVPLDLVVGVVAWRVAGAAVRNAADALRRRAAPPSTGRASHSPAGSGHHVTHRVAA
jgi:predicted Na+-dependent transporter